MLRMALGVVLTSSLLFPAFAGETSPPLDEIRAQQARIYEDARANRGAYAEMSVHDRNQLLSKQESVLTLIEGKESVEELERGERMLVFNELESIKAILKSTEREKIVCESVKKTGSHMRTRECRSVAERRGDREDAVDNWAKNRATCGIACIH